MKTYVYNTNQFRAVFESMNSIEGGNARALINLGKIKMLDGNLVDGSEFVEVVNSAIEYFRNNYPLEYKYLRGATIIYVLDDYVTNTMCVDGNMNYCINVGFLYNPFPYGMGMDSKNIFTILYHEVMHTMLTHIERMKVYNSKATKKSTWKELNIAGDLEINDMMVADRICNRNFWEIMEACYDDSVKGLPFETIIKNYEDVVNKFKSKTQKRNEMNKQKGQQKKQEKIKTSSDWKLGHKEARELIRKIYISTHRNAKKALEIIEQELSKNNNDVYKTFNNLKNQFKN